MPSAGSSSVPGGDAVFEAPVPRFQPGRRHRTTSELDSSLTASQEGEGHDSFWDHIRLNSRPSCVRLDDAGDPTEDTKAMNRILGQVHLDLCRYHECRRFDKDEASSNKDGSGAQKQSFIQDDTDGVPDKAPTGDYDRHSAWFHLEYATNCHILEAVVTMADIYLGKEHSLLADMNMDEDEDSWETGLELMERAAIMDDRSAMIFLAQTHDSGKDHDGSDSAKDWVKAVEWYEKSLDVEDCDMETLVNNDNNATGDSGYDASLDNPKYVILARLAEMYRCGGHGLAKATSRAGDLYNEAAEAAMECMKGKLANKYFMLAEECYGEEEEEEEQAVE